MPFSKISAALAAGAIAITVAIAYLLTDPPFRDSAFFLSLGFILLAEFFLFAGPHLVRTSGGNRMAAWHISMSIVPVIYAAGVAFMAVAAIRGTSWNVLLSGQLAWLLLFFITIVIVRASGSGVASSAAASQSNRASYSGLVARFDSISDRVELLSPADAAALRPVARKLREDLRYSTDDSGSSGAFDENLEACFRKMNQAVDGLEASAAANEPLAEFSRQVTIARQVLSRREDAIAQARR
jgi:hypothetical protein